MFKKCKIVLRPTNHKVKNGQQPVSAYAKPVTRGGLRVPISLAHLNRLLERGWQAYHVDVLSDDDIKVGDWLSMDKTPYLHEGTQTNSVLPDAVIHRDVDGRLVCSDESCFSRIVASTDPSLGLPEISCSDLKMFCGVQPKEVWVKYCYDIETFAGRVLESVALSSNTISIKWRERTYTRAEVIAIIEEVVKESTGMDCVNPEIFLGGL